MKLSGSIFNITNANAMESIRRYAKMLLEISNTFQPVVVTGGGKIARHYINIARSLGSDEANLDIIGIEVSRLNAKLLISALGEQVYSRVPKNLEEVAIAAASGQIVIAGGLHPGQSTNATSALIAETVKASKFLNATDVDGIYDSDPKKNRDAKLFERITIKECMEILGSESSMAGKYELIDIVALKVIERSRIPTWVLRSNVKNIKHAVNNDAKYHVGTEIVVEPTAK
ncbi:MAG TPA: UMP kinase [Candidatus Bathyarchaeia archaeon]|jgi:uridylate kinase|nr:UMP kinase [Candidatus Bathyarchaeia archaeon]